ncbi:MAG: amidohydrolase family protein [Acidobacteria bacterium]|nr:amidohydrolase family protein [Acidobacteriota bacterium]
MNRRTFLGGAAAMAMGANPIAVIDSHIHLFDPGRPQGVPWPDRENALLYQPALPARYRKIAQPHGVTGAIEVECSPWAEDNQWVLDVVERNPMILGTIGNLEPGKPGFAKYFERFRKNPLFLGIRCGTLWNRDFTAALANPRYVADLKLLAEAGLAVDLAQPGKALIAGAIRLTDLVPNLRLIVDHLPQMDPAEADPRELAQRPQVFVKISEVLRRTGDRVPDSVEFYRPRLDVLWELFGENRLIYGSDWPNSDIWAPFAQGFRIVQEYIMAKGRPAAEKFYWKNSQAAYRWLARTPEQPRAGDSPHFTTPILTARY